MWHHRVIVLCYWRINWWWWWWCCYARPGSHDKLWIICDCRPRCELVMYSLNRSGVKEVLRHCGMTLELAISHAGLPWHCLGHIEGQGHRLKFTITGGKCYSSDRCNLEWRLSNKSVCHLIAWSEASGERLNWTIILSLVSTRLITVWLTDSFIYNCVKTGTLVIVCWRTWNFCLNMSFHQQRHLEKK